MAKDYDILHDLNIIKELSQVTNEELAKNIGISELTLFRWLNKEEKIPENIYSVIYTYAFNKHIRINNIKSQLLEEQYNSDDIQILYHGAKNIIEGEISVNKTVGKKDFGQGFYSGETLEQSAMFISGYENSSLYILKFIKNSDLKYRKFKVNRDWMLTIAYNRGRLKAYEQHPLIQSIKNNLNSLDYVIAPIADNQMYQIIDDYIDGFITDIECEHALSATDLGYQYVFLTQKAVDNISIVSHCYLAKEEKEYYLKRREEQNIIGIDKIKIAKREFRGQGIYIDQLLK